MGKVQEFEYDVTRQIFHGYRQEATTSVLKHTYPTHMQVEEQYTQEALRADEQVAGLKQQIADLEDKLQNSSMAGQVQR